MTLKMTIIASARFRTNSSGYSLVGSSLTLRRPCFAAVQQQGIPSAGDYMANSF
jgi:hypothetical protein